MALSIIANPSDIETRCDIETHGDDKEGKVSPSHSWYSGEQNIAYDISCDDPYFGSEYVPMRLRDMPRTINGLLIWYLSLK
jgi:hypothetical protein